MAARAWRQIQRMSIVDQLARPWAVSALVGRKIFEGGWGDPSWFHDLREISLRVQQGDLSSHDEFVRPSLDIQWQPDKYKRLRSGVTLEEGIFRSPASRFLPPEAQECHFQLISAPGSFRTRLANNTIVRSRPLCVVLAPTGDHGYGRRRLQLGVPLAKAGVSTLLIENPFYGPRKPDDQWRSALLHVSDLYSMGAALVSESLSLFNHFESHAHDRGFDTFGVAGISLGGQMACHVAVHAQRDLAVIPLIAPYSAAPVFTEGVLQAWCDWEALERDVDAYWELEMSDAVHEDVPEPETRAERARALMHHCLTTTTDMTRYPLPRVTDAVVQVAARHDGYVPRPGKLLSDHWPGSELRWVTGGHVQAVLLHAGVFKKAVVDAMHRIVCHHLSSSPR